MPEASSWIVTTAGNRPAKEVASALSQAGFKVEDVLGEIGVITGRCAAGKIPALRKLPGVADISPSTDIDIGPPGSPDSW